MTEIDEKYQELGGSGSVLGNPIAPEQDCAGGTGRFRRYELGRIYFSAETGAHEVHGLILDKWLTLGAEQSHLGFPTSDEQSVDDGKLSEFQRGAIYWSGATGAHALHGEILTKWRALDDTTRATIGFPITDQRWVSDGAGRYADFAGGSIYWSPKSGAHTIYGAIHGKWMAIGGPRGPLGYPTTDEDGTGHRFNLFEHGSIYWRGGVGAFFVLGEIDEKWAAQGREQGALGFPLSDELPGTQFNTRFNDFENGTLTRVVSAPSPAGPQSATPPFVTAFDLDLQTITSRHETETGNGFRLLSLSVYGPAADPRYAAVWVKDRGPEQQVLFKAKASGYLQFLRKQLDGGFVPVIISATGTASNAVFALVCEKRPGPVPVIRHRLTAGPEDGVHHRETFAFWCQWARANGHILRWASIYGNADDPRYAGIWELDRKEVPWNVAYHDAQHNLAHNFLPEAAPELLGKGDLQAVIEAQSFWARPAFRTRAASGRQLVLFREDRAGTTVTREGLSGSGVDSEAAKLNLIPVCVQGTRGSGASRFTAVFAKHVRPQARKLTVTGQEIKTLAALDDVMGDMLRRSGARNGSLAVARNGRLVYARAFTWAEADQKPIEPSHIFRIASISKSITAVAVYQLLDNEAALDQPLLDHLELDLPAGADPRFEKITVRQMLTHHSGLQRNIADSITRADEVLAFFEGKKSLPLTMADVATYMASLPLDFDPNNEFDDPKKEAYSNLAFLYLTWLVEQKRGNYVDAVRKHIFDPIGLPDRPRITGSLTTSKGKLEVIAYDRELRVGRSVMSEERPVVPHEYGTLNFNVTPGVGAWALAPADYVRFLSKLFDGSNTLLDSSFLSSPSRTKRELEAIKKHGGGLAGAETFAEHFEHDGSDLAYAVFFNKDVPGDFVARVRDVVTALDKSAWPVLSGPGKAFDLFGSESIGIQ